MPSLRIGDVLTRRKEVVLVEDDRTYRRVTISLNHNGVKLRDSKPGHEIGTKRQYRTRAGDFILSRIDARNAAFGIVPDDLDGAIVTNDFLSFDIDEARVDRTYFYLLSQTDAFLDACVRSSTGTTNRQRIQEKFFLGYTFDVPDLAAQKRAVEHYHELSRPLARLTDALEAQADDLAALRASILDDAVRGRLTERDPEDEPADALLARIAAEKKRLYEAGDIRKPKKLPAVTKDEQPFDLPEGWVWTRLGALATEVDAGWSPKCHNRTIESGEWGVLKVSAVSWGRFDPNEHKTLPSSKEPKPEKTVRAGDFLITRANTEELVARSVIVDRDFPRLMMSDKIIRLAFSDATVPEYANAANGCSFARQYYADNATGTSSSMKNVSQGVIKAMPVPLPPLEEQRRIVARVDTLLALCDRLEARLAHAREDAEALTRAVLAEALGAA